ncbi:hypothetical protein HDV05_004761 [Chytridiales sp. JEL 0842]|nr:hypothetical protein HDV05_004761 [Chytridiales sp. JEL 0842]
MLLKALLLNELEDLLEDVSSESSRRAQGGVVIGTTEIKSPAREEKKEESAAGVEDKGAKKKEGKRKEGANVSSWRARIGKPSDEQLREVTVDVMDEMARRREKEATSHPNAAKLVRSSHASLQKNLKRYGLSFTKTCKRGG